MNDEVNEKKTNEEETLPFDEKIKEKALERVERQLKAMKRGEEYVE